METKLKSLLQEWIEKSTPADWHNLAREWQWENGVEPLQWIIAQPDCDKATALLIYWQGNPGYYCQFDHTTTFKEYDNKKNELSLLLDIENRYTSNFYQTHRWAYKPTEDEVTGSNLIEENKQDEKKGIRNIPLLMKEALEGEEVEWEHFEDGLPIEIYYKIHGI